MHFLLYGFMISFSNMIVDSSSIGQKVGKTVQEILVFHDPKKRAAKAKKHADNKVQQLAALPSKSPPLDGRSSIILLSSLLQDNLVTSASTSHTIGSSPSPVEPDPIEIILLKLQQHLIAGQNCPVLLLCLAGAFNQIQWPS
jgi:hypothetical protein